MLMCKSPDYSWLFKASIKNGTKNFKVRNSSDEHTCPLKDRVFDQSQVTVAFVGGIITPKLVNHKRIIMLGDIIDDIK